jgi:diketogulonate reductase-like aldo/keto reductase
MKRKIKNKKIANFEVNPLGIGTWKMGGDILPSVFGRNDADEVEAIKYSIELGQNHIDTAEMYGTGKAEKLVGKAIKNENRSKLFIASKIWRHHTNKSSVVPAVEKMLERLRTDYLDLIYVHYPWSNMHGYIEGLNATVAKGLAKNLGVSNFNLQQLKKAVALSERHIVANQVLYNVYKRGLVTDEMLEYCKAQNIMIVAYTPLEDVVAESKEGSLLKELAEKYNKTSAQIALNWLIRQDNVITIPKAVSKKHIEDNLGALQFKLSDEDFVRIKEIGSHSTKVW